MKNETMSLFKNTIAFLTATQIVFVGHSQSFLEAETIDVLTPRQRVVQTLLGNQNISAAQTKNVATSDTKTLKAVIAVTPKGKAASVPEDETAVAVMSSPQPFEKEALADAPTTRMTGLSAGPLEGRNGFFQTAEDYLKARSWKTKQERETLSDHLTLTYRVTRKDIKTDIALDPETVLLTLGPDFAQIKRGNEPARLYDFKLRRMITLGDKTFSNVSLFGARYNDINTVQRMTQNGQKRDIDVKAKTLTNKALGPALPGAKQKLDAYYLESSLGWAAAPLPKEDFLTFTSKDKFTATYKNESVFTARLNGPVFDIKTQAYNFIALLFNEAPIHPEILAALKTINSAPTQMIIQTASPNFPSGQTQIWALTDTVLEKNAFPLTAEYKSTSEQKDSMPLAFVITEAVYGRALQGPPAPEATLAAMRSRLNEGDVLPVWLSALSLSDKLGGCEVLSGLCEIIGRAEDVGRLDEDILGLIIAFENLGKNSTRIEGLKTLAPILEDADTPSIILQRGAIGLTKLKRYQIQGAGLSNFNPEELLKQAIAKDPYDYAAYKGLAQLFAAQGRFAESWDIADALRAFPYAPESLKTSFDRAELKLLRGAPGFFPPIYP